jgi:hypothetical protein
MREGGREKALLALAPHKRAHAVCRKGVGLASSRSGRSLEARCLNGVVRISFRGNAAKENALLEKDLEMKEKSFEKIEKHRKPVSSSVTVWRKR